MEAVILSVCYKLYHIVNIIWFIWYGPYQNMAFYFRILIVFYRFVKKPATRTIVTLVNHVTLQYVTHVNIKWTILARFSEHQIWIALSLHLQQTISKNVWTKVWFKKSTFMALFMTFHDFLCLIKFLNLHRRRLRHQHDSRMGHSWIPDNENKPWLCSVRLGLSREPCNG